MSVLCQDFQDFEIILVDDGSPDSCPQICDRLASTDSRISVIHKNNGGLSSARNAGINRAKGDYITFLDSDDQWMPGLLAPIMNQLSESGVSMLLFEGNSLYDDGTVYQRMDMLRTQGLFRIFSTSEFYSMLISSGNFRESACTKILNLDFLISNKLKFRHGIIGEDTEWMMKVLRKVDRVAYSPIPLFLCTEGRIGSITNTASNKSVWDAISIIKSSLDYYNENPRSNFKELELAQCSYLWSIALGLYSGLLKCDRGGLKAELKSVKKHLNLNIHPKSRMVGRIYSLLGFDLTSFILGMYIRLHKMNLINKKIRINSNGN